MREALRDLQIQNARLSDALQSVLPGAHMIVTQQNMSERIVEGLDLFQRFGSMFEYARGRADTIPTGFF